MQPTAHLATARCRWDTRADDAHLTRALRGTLVKLATVGAEVRAVRSLAAQRTRSDVHSRDCGSRACHVALGQRGTSRCNTVV